MFSIFRSPQFWQGWSVQWFLPKQIFYEKFGHLRYKKGRKGLTSFQGYRAAFVIL